MSTRQIKDAVNHSTGELVYFKSHAKATFMSDGKTVEDAINSIEIPSLDEYVTETELNDKGFLTEHQDISHLATKVEVSESIADIDFYDIQNNPVVNTEEGKLLFVDETGNIGLQLEDDVLYVKDVVADGHILSEKADKNYVDEAIKNIGGGGENIDLSDYETKEDSISKLQEAKDYTDIKTDELRDVVTQTLSLSAVGDTWCSFYVDITLEQLQQSLGTNAASITTSYDGGETKIKSTYNADTNTWSGDLTTLDVTKMYQIYINTDCEISLTGRKIPNSIRYILNPGWNWIGYPSNNANVDINVALKNLTPADGDRIKTQNNGFAEFAFGKWMGALKQLVHGQGYMYNNKSDETKTLVFTTELIDTKSELNKKQDILVSGTNIKTVNGESLLGEGNIVISNETDMSNYYTKEEIDNTVGDINTILETIING